MKNFMQILKRNILGTEFNLESGKFAFRADGEVYAKAGDTSVLVTVTVDKKKGDSDFFPLTVEYVEKMYSTGKISTNKFVKREKFPSDSAILKARAIDRSIRPYFPKNFKNPVLVVVTLFSYDEINDPLVLAINAVSVALQNSSIPFSGPICAVRIGLSDGKLVVNPTIKNLASSDLDLLFSGKGDEVSMVEVGANQVPEELMKEAFDLACSSFAKFEEFQNEFLKLNTEKKEKISVPADLHADEILESIGITKEELSDKLSDALFTHDDEVYQNKISEIKTFVNNVIEEKDLSLEITPAILEEIIYKYSRSIARVSILENSKRLSGREMDEIRELKIEVDSIPVVHGSALFSRGITQALSITTLGSLSDVEMSESYLGEEEKYYIHHYNGPSYSLGEAGRFSYMPGRREIGHGELAEKAIKPVLPDLASFPYTIRVVSEVLSQSGSSSMASTCGSSLSLMDAGVPIKAAVAGIAIGLVSEENFVYGKNKYKLVMDMADKEDFFGDMDFKVAGTRHGITAIQMDNKMGGVHKDILKEALDLAFTGRNRVLDKMDEIIKVPRAEVKANAPKVRQIQINPQRIGELIGPGGKVIKSITEKTGAKIDISDSGLVTILSTNFDSLLQALTMVDSLVGELNIGQIYDAVVDGIKEYGVFVNIGGNHSGLVHISEMTLEKGKLPDSIYKIGDKLKVMMKGKDSSGRLQLSLKI